VDDLIQEFLVESNENLDRYDSELVKLESEPDSQPLLSSIFRSIHSIKGACGFLGFQKLEKLAHAGENLLSKLRDGQIKLTAEIGSALLEAGDGIRKMLASIGTSGNDGEEEFPVYRLRGRLLPLVYLNRELKLQSGASAAAAVNIVVLQVDSRQFGLVVDEVHDTEEIVVKPLGKHFKAIKVYAGATIMATASRL